MIAHLSIGIPAGQRRPLLVRLAIVWAVALVIALAQWASAAQGRLDHSLVYSYAISTLIWAFTDLLRVVLWRPLRSTPPDYWPSPQRAVPLLALGIAAGYALGTWLGDRYAGHSTWDLLTLHPERFAGLLSSSAAISLGFIGFFYLQAKSQSLQRQASEAQLMLLQSQLQPHMLFNTLAHVRALVQTDTRKALAMIDHLDDYLRSALQASRQTWQPLAVELQRLQDYLALMGIRLGPRLRCSLDVPDDLQQQPVPSFILQPLVENAIRHGIEPSIEGGQLQIEARQDGHMLVIAVTNQGVPLSSPVVEGFGLGHVRERLRSLMGHTATLSLSSSADDHTCACLRWPLQPPLQP